MLDVGATIGDYRLDRRIGRGGMGVVFRATQLSLGRPVALKVITPDLAEDQTFRERFKREARLAAQIDHPNIVPIYQADEVDGHLFIAMRFVPGTDLRDHSILRGRLDPAQAVRIIEQVAAALDAAHEQGLVHRDVKPANVLLSGKAGAEHVYLTDFGLTKHLSASVSLTRTGTIVGTLDYIAPEQLKGGPIDGRVDVYALGCVLFELLTAMVPFDRESEAAKLYAHISDPPPRPSDVLGSEAAAFDPVIRKAMAKDRENRFATAGALAQAARAALTADPADEAPTRLPQPSAPALRDAPGAEEPPPRVPAAPAAGATAVDAPPPRPPAPGSAGALRRRPSRRAAAIAAVCAAAAVAAIVVLTSSSGGPGGSPQSGAAGAARALEGAPDCEVLPASSHFNQRVDKLPVAANSDALVESIGRDETVHPDFGSGTYEGSPIGIPYNVVGKDQKKVQVTFEYPDESDKGPYPIPANPKLEGGTEDRHLLLVDRDDCRLYELYAARPEEGGGDGWSAYAGAIFDLRANTLRPTGWTSADGAGLPILPGLARYDEVAKGSIDHALRFTAPQTRDAFVYPARHSASDDDDPDLPPMGTRIRLKASTDISILGLQAQVVARGLQRYGALLADNGSPWFFTGAPDSGWDNDDLHTLNHLKGSDFEVVDTTDLPKPSGS